MRPSGRTVMHFSALRRSYMHDRHVLMEAVRQNGRALRFASEELKPNREVVMEAVRQNGSCRTFCRTCV